MPIGDAESFPAMLRITLAGSAIMLCLLVPGWQLLRLIAGDAWRRLPAFRRVGYSLVVSTVLLCALQSLSFLLPVAAVRLTDQALLAGCLILALWRLAIWRGWRALARDEHSLLAGALVIVMSAIWWGHLSAIVPGPLAAGYADFTAYYRAIDNLSRGSFPLIDFRIADFDGEHYFMPTFYPALTLLSTFFKTTLPDIQHFLPVVSTSIGALGLFFGGGYLYEKHAAFGVDGPLAVLSLGLMPLLLAGHSTFTAEQENRRRNDEEEQRPGISQGLEEDDRLPVLLAFQPQVEDDGTWEAGQRQNHRSAAEENE